MGDEERKLTKKEICSIFHSRNDEIEIIGEKQKDVESSIVDNLFFNPSRYDMSVVGRIKLNRSLNLNIDENYTALTDEDIKKAEAHKQKVAAEVLMPR